MARRFLILLHGLSATWIGAAGVVLTTSSFLLFLGLEALRVLGLLTNAYAGLVTYLSLPALFVVGLLLIPLGWRRYRKRSGLSTRELLSDRFGPRLVEPALTGSRLALIIGGLTLVNVGFLGAASVRTLHFMDQPAFCGTACHSVMGPEWATYQQSPHAHVPCVDCHVGEGAGALVDSKINGLWQMISITFDLYGRPIPTPVHNLRPARETCEKCHWPAKLYGDRIEVATHYALDRASTPHYTTLAMKVGAGTEESRGRIHWHVAPETTVRYASVRDEREQILWVEVERPDGGTRRYTNRVLGAASGASLRAGASDGAHTRNGDARLAAEGGDGSEGDVRPYTRTMDCVDCHNRATHIYEDPERAVDRAIAAGRIDRDLPFAKKIVLGAVLAEYPSDAAQRAGVEDEIRGRYARDFAEETLGMQRQIDAAVTTAQEIVARNVHHRMNVTWGAYPNHLGHEHGGGCFRCHSPDLVDDQGHSIPHGCTLCHSIFAYDSDEPYRFVQQPDPKAPDFTMHTYLRDELTSGPPEH